MFRLHEKIYNVIYNVLHIKDSIVIFQSKNFENYFLNIKENHDELRHKLEKYASQICMLDNNIILIYNDGDYDKFDNTLNKIFIKKEEETKISLNYINENHKENFFICYSGSIFERKMGIYDFEKGSSIYLKENFFPWIFIEDKLIGKNNEKVILYDYFDGSTKWQLDITDLGRYRRNSQSPEEAGKVEKIIGVYDDLLIVT